MAICNECGKHFHNKSNMNRHKRIMHGDADETVDDDVEDESLSESESTTENESSSEQSSSEQSSSDTDEVDVWKVITDEAADEENGGILDAFKNNVMFCRSLKRDETYKAVMKTVEKAKDDDAMEFREALDYAVDKRKFLIHRSADEAEEIRTDEEVDSAAV